jgi:hypothetical protein
LCDLFIHSSLTHHSRGLKRERIRRNHSLGLLKLSSAVSADNSVFFRCQLPMRKLNLIKKQKFSSYRKKKNETTETTQNFTKLSPVTHFVRRKNYSSTFPKKHSSRPPPPAAHHRRPTHGATKLLAGKAIFTERERKASERITRKGIMSQNDVDARGALY